MSQHAQLREFAQKRIGNAVADAGRRNDQVVGRLPFADGSQLLSQFFVDPGDLLLNDVKESLASFEAGSLVKDTLKPIRDVTFHYNHLSQNGEVGKLIDQALSEVIEKDTLEIGFSDEVNSAMGQRYFFAEKFRSGILDQLLSSELVSVISSASVNIVSLVDSLLSDLKKNHEQ